MISTGREIGFMSAVDGGGEVSRPNEDGDVTLDVDTHYFIVGGAAGALIESVQLVTDGTIVGVFTVETSNYPRDQIQGPELVTDYNEVSGKWIKENPTTAYVGTVGTGWTVSNLTLTKAAGVGGAMIHLGNMGAKRCRIAAAISTGGKMAAIAHAKS